MKTSVQRYRATNRLRKSFKRQVVSSKFLVPALVICTLIVLACIHVWQSVYVMGLLREVNVLEKENSLLQNKVKKSRADIVELTRLNRIDSLAVGKLGMSKVNFDNLFTLISDRPASAPDGIDEVVGSLKKFAEHLPVISESRAETGEIFDEK